MTTPINPKTNSGVDNPVFSLEGDSLTITTTTTTTTSISPVQRIVTGSSTSGSSGVPVASGGGLTLEDLTKLLDIVKQTSQVQQQSEGARGGSAPTGRITSSGRSGDGSLQQILGGLTTSGGTQNLSSLLETLGGNQDLSALLGALGDKNTKDQLSALLSVLNGKGNSTLTSVSKSVSDLATAVTNLLSATSASESVGSAMSASLSVAQLIYYAATSEAARKSGQFCHRECGPSCMGNCGCPGCGCPEGECGCGWFGKFFCNLWGSICGVDSYSSELLTELERLEKHHGKSVLLIALSNLQLDVVGILAGNVKVSLPPVKDIEEACKAVSQDFVNILQKQSAGLWCAAATKFSSMLEDGFWRGCIVKALSYPTEKMNEDLLEKMVYVISTSAGGKACSNYNTSRMAESMSEVKIVCPKKGKAKNLGVLQVAGITELVSRVLWIASDEGSRPVWISTEDLMTLVAIVCARSRISFASQDGTAIESRIYDDPRIKELFAVARQEKEGQGGVQTLQISQQFVQLAERCFSSTSQR